MSNICMSQNLVEGGIDLPESKCLWCCNITKQKAGYVGVYCYECHNITSGEEFSGHIAMWRRIKLNLDRKDMAKLMGLSHHTIKAYEFKLCPRKYFKFTEKLMGDAS